VEFAALAAEAGLRLRVVASTASVRSDPALLRRILQNLLSNAVRYTGEGRILMGCRRVGESLRIEVRDTGPGIDPALHGAIFDEFRRLDQGNDRGQGMGLQGMGLGLAIVDRTARMLGHAVAIRSEPGRGACFSVTVPLAARPATAAAETPPAAPAALRDMVVLCVDDDPRVLAGLAAMLEGWGCRTLLADGAETALAALDAGPPEAVLVDFQLGRGLDGLALLEALAPHLPPALPAAILTASRSPDVLDRVRAAGVPLLPKPVRPAALRRFLSGARLRAPASSEPVLEPSDDRTA
jgi:CheY-like chemotaxis protein/anti-sigma regulatory factor (Ser/Thr protein kinase)